MSARHVEPGTQTKERTMAEAKKLSKFTISQAGQDFRLHIEDESGEVLELTATRDQLDVLDDALEELLDQGEGEDEVKA